MSKHLRELIIEISSGRMVEQKEILEQKIEEWRLGFGIKHEQTDDITIAGFEI
jgi:hypothetical protein